MIKKFLQGIAWGAGIALGFYWMSQFIVHYMR